MLVVRASKVTPSEFWQLSPNEVGLFLDTFEEKIKDDPGKLSAVQRDHLETRAAKLRAKGLKLL